MQPPLQQYLEQLHARIAAEQQGGTVASYIPALAKARREAFGICVVTADGYVYSVGDCAERFTVQSISKPFTYAMALADQGREAVLQKVGVEPSGEAFNSIGLHPQRGTPLNPMINTGAIAITGLVNGSDAEAQWQRIQQGFGQFAGRALPLNEAVYRSESETGFRNRAISWMLRNAGVIEGDPEPVLENYFRQCSLEVDCRDLAIMAATLANAGLNPVTGERATTPAIVESVLSVMSTCGMYNYAGEWLFEVGIPAKSGVSGGLMAVLPGKFGIAVFAPPLDERGNCLRGIAVCEALANDFGFHLMSATRTAALVVKRVVRGSDLPTTRRRVPAQLALLRAHADAVRVIMLQGEVSFDSAEYLSRLIVREGAARYWVLDLQDVSWIAPVAARSLQQIRLQLMTAGRGRQLVFARLGRYPQLAQALQEALHAGEPEHLSFEDNRIAVEWAQSDWLAHRSTVAKTPVEKVKALTLADFALFTGVSAAAMRALEGIAKSLCFGAGEAVFNAGDELANRLPARSDDDCVFFIESGEVVVRVPALDGGEERVTGLGPGMVFGEMALVNRPQRNVTVRAETEVQCWVLHASHISELASTQYPELKEVLLRNLVEALADRLIETNRLVGVLAG